MNIIDIIPLIYAKLYLFMLIGTRMSGLFSTFFLFKSTLVNARITIAVSAILSFYVLLIYPSTNFTGDLFSASMILTAIIQFFIGFIAGFILNIVFEIVLIAGQFISTQIGLSMASLIDPMFGNITQLSQFYTFSVTLIFFLINGHLRMIETLINSFSVLPINYSIHQSHFLLDMLSYSSLLFSGALSLALAVTIAVLITNLALAVMTRFAPQFNIFSIGMNLTVLLGLLCVYYFFGLFIDKCEVLISDGFIHIKQIYHAMR